MTNSARRSAELKNDRPEDQVLQFVSAREQATILLAWMQAPNGRTGHRPGAELKAAWQDLYLLHHWQPATWQSVAHQLRILIGDKTKRFTNTRDASGKRRRAVVILIPPLRDAKVDSDRNSANPEVVAAAHSSRMPPKFRHELISSTGPQVMAPSGGTSAPFDGIDQHTPMRGSEVVAHSSGTSVPFDGVGWQGLATSLRQWLAIGPKSK